MRLVLLALISAVIGIALPAEPLKLDDRRTSLWYGGYTFQKVFDKSNEQWSFQVTKADRLIRTFVDPDRRNSHPEDRGWALSMGVIHAIAGSERQVALRMWTGNGKCCNVYWLVEVAPELRVILDTSAYDFDDLEAVHHMDGDGNMEFSFSTTKFDYFGVGYVFSPKPLAWFKYDRKLGKYVAANDLCFAETRKQIRKDEARLHARPWEKDPSPDNQELRQVVLDIVLAFLYAGHDTEAWAFFDREYPDQEKAQQKMYVERRAKSDPFFQAVRKRMQGALQ
jgi:hypothetical protein